jgi:branched-chain amino acid transport system permease protein
MTCMLAQQLVNGIISGAIYALFALGFTLMFGVLRVINLTYGLYFSAGALIALLAVQRLSWPLYAAIPAAILASGTLALFLDHMLLAPLRRARAPELASLMVTLGATLVLYSLLASPLALGTEIRRFPPGVIGGAAIEFLSVRISLTQILILATTLAAVLALTGLMQNTRLGLAVRAIAENAAVAQLMGIDQARHLHFVSFLSGALAATAGILIGLNFNAIQPYMGETMMLKGFAVIILGGLGNIRGALIAGLFLGVLETLTAGYIASSLKEATGFVLLVLTLWWRPTGLFGRATEGRA